MKMLLIPMLFCMTAWLVPADGLSQTRWSEWKQVEGNPQIQYRMAFAKEDSYQSKSGYYVEVKNDSASRIWFNLHLEPSGTSDQNRGKITLKPLTKSVVGIFWSFATANEMPEVKFSNVQSEDQPAALTSKNEPESGSR